MVLLDDVDGMDCLGLAEGESHCGCESSDALADEDDERVERVVRLAVVRDVVVVVLGQRVRHRLGAQQRVLAERVARHREVGEEAGGQQPREHGQPAKRAIQPDRLYPLSRFALQTVLFCRITFPK